VFKKFDFIEATFDRCARLGNLRINQKDLTDWDEPTSFGLVTALDEIHDPGAFRDEK
jgi:hypothetical protein